MGGPMEFDYKTVSYVCPQCRRRYEAKLPFATQNLRARLEKGRWCACGAIHKLEYKVRQKRTGEIALKVINFFCDGELHSKTRFRLLD